MVTLAMSSSQNSIRYNVARKFLSKALTNPIIVRWVKVTDDAKVYEIALRPIQSHPRCELIDPKPLIRYWLERTSLFLWSQRHARRHDIGHAVTRRVELVSPQLVVSTQKAGTGKTFKQKHPRLCRFYGRAFIVARTHLRNAL